MTLGGPTYVRQASRIPNIDAHIWRSHAREAHVLSFRVPRRPGRTPDFDISARPREVASLQALRERKLFMAERHKRIVSYNGMGTATRVSTDTRTVCMQQMVPTQFGPMRLHWLSVHPLRHAGATYGRVSVHLSMVISAPVQKAWKVAAQFGNMAQWL